MRTLWYETVEAVALKAVAYGVTPDVYSDLGRTRRLLRWDVSGRCERPVPVELHARYSANAKRKVKPLTVILETKCRKCGWCRAKRSQLWSDRSLIEYQRSSRTWLATLTIEPHYQYEALTDARNIYGDFDALADEQKFARRVSVLGQEVTRFIKRVRKNSGAPFRYLLVAERHKSGDPHFHMLINECSDLAPVRKAVLKNAWHYGFSKFTLVNDPRGAVYVCKYLNKDSCTRMRASFKYGLDHPVLTRAKTHSSLERA